MDSLGLGAAAVSVLFFGSNFVVLKNYKTGDGMFFNWIMSFAILTVGMIVQLIECYKEGSDGSTQCPAFEPMAMAGGAIWATGNMLTPHIVKSIGLGLGMALWGSVNMLAGWAQGKFGLFGLTADKISNPGLNYAGVALSTMAIGVFLFIKPTVDGPKSAGGADEESAEGLLDGDVDKLGAGGEDGAEAADGGDPSWLDRLPAPAKRAFGIGGSAAAGIMYGLNFTPPSYVAQHAGSAEYPNASSNLVDYVFPHFCGIFLANTAFFLTYAAFKRNKPDLFPQIVLPGFVSGAMWAIAQSCWFIANGRLSLSIAFPLIATGPGLVASLWGAFVFKEIQGRRNLMFLGAAFMLVIASAVTISLSK